MEEMDQNLLSIIEPLVEKAQKLGADEVEFYAQKEQTKTAYIESSKLKSAISNSDQGVGIRVIKNNSLGYSCTNSFEKRKIELCLNKALSFAKIAPPEKNYFLGKKQKITKVSGLYDADIEGTTINDCINHATDFIKECYAIDKRINMESGAFTSSTLINAIATSNGISLEEKKAVFSIEVGGMATDGSDIGSWDEEYTNYITLDDINTEEIAQVFVRKLINNLNAKKTKPFVGDAIFSPEVVRSFISIIVKAAKANAIQTNRSYLCDRLGEKIFYEDLTIVDDGSLPNSYASGTFDREGTPHKEYTIIDKGIFSTILYDTFSANNDSVFSTGHARSSYRDLPEIAITNLEVKPGRMAVEEMISETKEGILFNRISSSPDPISGDFAAVLKGGRKIKNGEVKETLKEITAVGNIFNIMKSEFEVSNEQKELKYFESWKVPYIKTTGMQYIT
ncbi:MAG: TldD/PmbA family protein [Candidatus Heimdallarchaeota archaeon]|nr:TldD/PmbA family protein [Candidatus Heimdallarchaeota archaeon]